MIRVESLAGPVPTEAFLRAANEISYVAAEVGRALRGGDTGLLTEAANGLAKGWSITDALFERPGDFVADRPMEELQHYAVALVLAPPEHLTLVPSRVRQGVRDIAAKCEERPEGFSDAALRALRRVAHNVGRKVRVTLSAGLGEGHAVALDESLARHIDGWLNGQNAAIGSVEGKLELISIHDRLRFTIYGREGLRIECLFPEAMLAQVKGALGERVALRGRIRYRRDGKPATVEARVLKTMRPASQLPTVESVLEGISR